MDIMNSKKTLLSLINGGILGAAPTGSSVVKFAYTENIAKVGTAADGTITFYADTTNNTGIVAVGDKIVSSKIFDVTAAAKSGGKNGEKTITVSYFNAATKAKATTTFDVVDAAAAKAYFEEYFESSQSIAITDGTADVIVDGETILIDANDGLKSGLKLVYVAGTAETGASIQLQDANNTALNTIPVSNIIGNGVLDHSTYDKQKNELHLFFKTPQPDVYNEVVIPVGEILDINDIIIKNDSSIYLTATADTSVMNLGVLLQDVSTADADHNGLASAKTIREYVDSKSTILSVSASGDNYVDASVDSVDNKHINVAATDKTKTAVALAETAVQGVVEGTSVEGYVALNVSAKSDASVITITTDDSALSAKITEIDASIDALQAKDVEIDASIDALQAKDEEIDASIDALQAKDVEIDASIDALQAKDEEIDASIDALQAKDVEIDSSIDRLDASVSAIETAIAAMDADLSANTLDGSIAITLAETDGKVTSIGVSATKAETTFTPAAGNVPASLSSTNGILTGKSIEDIVAYVDAKSGAIDSSLSDTDTPNFISIHEEQVDGEIKVFTVNSSYGAYDYTAGTHTFGTPTDGLAKVADTQTFVQNVVESLDLAANASDASAADASNFVKTTISETDGIVKNESVEVTYATVTAAPGDITVTQNGIVKGDVLEAAIEGALTWTVLS